MAVKLLPEYDTELVVLAMEKTLNSVAATLLCTPSD